MSNGFSDQPSLLTFAPYKALYQSQICKLFIEKHTLHSRKNLALMAQKPIEAIFIVIIRFFNSHQF